MKWVAMLGALSCLFLGGLSSQAQQKLEGENLLLAPPAGFKMAFRGSRDDVGIFEWVPNGETLEDWTEMMTVQVFKDRPDLDPKDFLAKIQTRWQAECNGSASAPVTAERINGYTAATMLLRCPLLPSTGKPEMTMFRAIKGKDALYLVQRAVRAADTPEQVARLEAYFAKVSACDVRSPAHPCPDLVPHRR
ncbi:hypothetical protein [Reyranella sp.]|uniref:hypothetical protein n=1 Tax=Reyranella sp. TaxID=1929291 RepID=UPI003BA8469C